MMPQPPQPGVMAPGAPPQAPQAAAVPPVPPQAVPMTEDEVKAWRARLKASRDAIKPIITKGKKNVERYANKAFEVAPTEDTIYVPLDFSYIEQKKAQLFFQTPEVRGEALQPQYEAAEKTFTAVMNHALGTKGVNAKAMMFETLTDVLCPTGYGATKIGYQPFVDGTKPVQVGERPVEVAQPGAILGLNTPTLMEPIFEDAPNVVAEKYYWTRFPPGWFRCPVDFRGSDFDDAAWLAMRFEEDVPEGEEYTSKADKDEMLLSQPPSGLDQAKQRKRCGLEVWYKASLFDTDTKHPERIRTFKLYDDEQDDVLPERKDSPFQRFQPDGTFLGMAGFPIHVLTLRYLPDAAFPQSDSSMIRQTVDEISKGRTQMIRRRDRALPQVGYDATRVLPETLAKIERNENTALIGFNGPVGDAFEPINKGNFGRENFEFNDIGHRDLDRIMAMGADGGVLRGNSPETATKSNMIQSAIDTRMEAERTRVLEFFVKGVNKLAGLYQLFADQEDYVRIVGPQGSQLVAWNKDAIGGKFAFSAKPNSHIRVDAAQASAQALQNYNQMRKDPNCNPEYLIKDVAEKLGLDPARLWVPPQPPQEEKPTVSWAIKMEDFIGPAAPVAVEIAKQVGVVVSPQALQAAQTIGAFVAAQAALQQAQQQQAQGQAQHGGAADQTEPINKHSLQKTGGTPGIGV